MKLRTETDEQRLPWLEILSPAGRERVGSEIPNNCKDRHGLNYSCQQKTLLVRRGERFSSHLCHMCEYHNGPNRAKAPETDGRGD